MAAMSTSLTEFADNGNSRQYILSTHTAVKPRMVIQSRKVPAGGQSVAEDRIYVFSGTSDSEGTPLTSRSSVEIVLRRPVNGTQADFDAMLVVARDIMASDELTATAGTQGWLK